MLAVLPVAVGKVGDCGSWRGLGTIRTMDGSGSWGMLWRHGRPGDSGCIAELTWPSL